MHPVLPSTTVKLNEDMTLATHQMHQHSTAHDDYCSRKGPRLLSPLAVEDEFHISRLAYMSSGGDHDDDNSVEKPQKVVRFDTVTVREHAITVGDHPLCSDSYPLTLDWDHCDSDHSYPVDVYEEERDVQGRKPIVRLSLGRRRQLLNGIGVNRVHKPRHGRFDQRLECPLRQESLLATYSSSLELERREDCPTCTNNCMRHGGFPAQMIQIQILEN